MSTACGTATTKCGTATTACGTATTAQSLLHVDEGTAQSAYSMDEATARSAHNMNETTAQSAHSMNEATESWSRIITHIQLSLDPDTSKWDSHHTHPSGTCNILIRNILIQVGHATYSSTET